MKYWLYNSIEWEKQLKELKNMRILGRGDRIVLLSQGIITKIMEVPIKSGKNDFSVVLEPQGGLIARPLWYKTQLQKPFNGIFGLYNLSKQEYGKIELSIMEKRKELVF